MDGDKMIDGVLALPPECTDGLNNPPGREVRRTKRAPYKIHHLSRRMDHRIDLGTFGRDISWTKQDKIFLRDKVNKLRERDNKVQRHEHRLEQWFHQDNLQNVRRSVQQKRNQLINMLQLRNIRQFEIVRKLPRTFHHIDARESQVTLRKMRNAIHELKYRRNMVHKKKIDLEKIQTNLNMEIEGFQRHRERILKIDSPRKKSYVDFQNTSTLYKAARYVNMSYKAIIKSMMEEALGAKLELQRLQRDQKEMHTLLRDFSFDLGKNLQRHALFAQEFEDRYKQMQKSVEQHLGEYLKMKDHNEEIQHKIEQKIEVIQSAQKHGQQQNACIKELRSRVKEVEQQIRSLQNATRCLEPSGIEARLLAQLPDAEHFMAEREHLRKARVSLIGKRKEMAVQHDRYLQEVDEEFHKNDEQIMMLRQTIETQRNLRIKHYQDIEWLSKVKIRLISHLRALKYNLSNVGPTEDAGNEKRYLIVLGSGDDTSEAGDKLKDLDEGSKILLDLEFLFEILVKRYDFNLSDEDITMFEHQREDRILERIAPISKMDKHDFFLQEEMKKLIDDNFDMNFTTTEVPTRKDIKTTSHLIVSKNAMEE